MTKNRFHYAWIILFACCCITSVTGIIGNSAAVFFQYVSDEFQVGMSRVTFYVTIQGLVHAMVTPFMVRLMNKNLKFTMLLAGVLELVGFALMGIYKSVYGFYFSGVLIGCGASVTMYLAIPAIINLWFKEKVGTVTGIAMATMGIWGAVFCAVAGILIQNYNWHIAYIALSIIGAIIYFPVIFFLVDTPEKKKWKPYGWNETMAATEEVANEGTYGYTYAEVKKTKSFYFMVVFMVAFCAIVCGSQYIAGFASGELGLNAAQAASVMSVYSIANLIGMTVFGWLNDKIGCKKAFIFGFVLIIIGQMMLIMTAQHAGMIMITSLVVGLGLCLYNVQPSLMTREIFGTREYSTIWATLSAAGSYSGAIGIFVLGAIYDKTGTYVTNFYLAIALAVLSLILGMAVLRNKK